MRARLLTLVCLGLLTGCSSVSERLAGWYVTRQLDGYFDFTSEQKQQARAVVDETISYARHHELTHWISLLRELRAGMHEGLTDASLARLQRRYDERLDFAVHYLSPRVAPILVRLDARQLDHFAARVREELEEQYEDLRLPPEQSRKQLEGKALSLIEDFVGDLDDVQSERVIALIRKVPNERSVQLRAALGNLSHFRGFMATHPSPDAVTAELRAMWERRYDALGAGHEKPARRAIQRTWMLGVYRLLTPKQRAHAEEELSDRIRVLARWQLP